MKRITVNADDLGLNEHNSRAIAQAFAEGLVTDTTMLANGQYYEPALGLARDGGFFDKIGIHFNLTEGVPLTEDIKAMPRFVTDGVFNKQYNRVKPLTRAEKDAIYLELSAQAEKLESSGIGITHADSHHHIHTGMFVAPIAERVCREHGISKIRLHRDLGRISLFKLIFKKRFNRRLRRQGFVTTDHFAYVIDIRGAEIPDSTEIMVHPDFDRDGVLIDRRGVEDGFPVGYELPYLGGGDYELRGYTQLS